MRILVTGGAGYLGSTAVPMLLAAGHEVHVLDSFLYQENSLGAHAHDPALGITVGDVRDGQLLDRLVPWAEAIIPLAAIVGVPACDRDPVAATTTNHDAILALLQRASAHQHIIMPTTNSAYGRGERGKHCDENSPLRPLSQYAREKVAVERALLCHPRATSLRLATVFGMSARMRLDLLVNDFVNRALRDRAIVLFESGFHRNYLHVRDVARLFLFVLDHRDEMAGQVYNAGLSDANLTKRELCERIARHVPELVVFEAPLHRDPDQRDYIVSNAKLESLGFQTAHRLDDGISELIKGIPMLRSLRHANV